MLFTELIQKHFVEFEKVHDFKIQPSIYSFNIFEMPPTFFRYVSAFINYL